MQLLCLKQFLREGYAEGVHMDWKEKKVIATEL
jgi:hypothetical protein